MLSLPVMSPTSHPMSSGEAVRQSKLLALAPIIKVAALIFAQSRSGTAMIRCASNRSRNPTRDERDHLAGDYLVNIENRHIRRSVGSDRHRPHAIHAVKGTAVEIVDVDLNGPRAAERRGVAVDPFASRMLRWSAPRGVAFRFHQPLDPVLQSRSVRFHALLEGYPSVAKSVPNRLGITPPSAFSRTGHLMEKTVSAMRSI